MSRSLAVQSTKTLMAVLYLTMAIAAITCSTIGHAAFGAAGGRRVVAPIPAFPLVPPSPQRPVWNPRMQDRMARGNSAGNIVLSDVYGSYERILNLGGYALMPMISPDGSKMAVWMSQGSLTGVWIIDLPEGTLYEGQLPAFDSSRGSGHGSASSFCWGADSRHLYVAAAGGPTYHPIIWEYDTWRPKNEPMAIADGFSPFVYGNQLFTITYTYSGYDVTSSTVEILSLDLSSKERKVFPGLNIGRVQTNGKYIFLSVTPKGAGTDTNNSIWKWRPGDPGLGVKVTYLNAWYFNLGPDGFLSVGSAFMNIVGKGMDFSCYRVDPETGDTRFVGYGLYPDVGLGSQSPPRHWAGFTPIDPKAP